MSKCIKNSSEIKGIDSYELMYEDYVTDCSGCGLVFRHKKSGARVCVISNNDENKVFMIGFRTPPTDDTGVPHIIEHSVLCGSRKFTPKDPFIELAKGSLNTFLNAMTYPDKTVYPVASCNDQDFKNLMDVYMDAVLHPNIYTKPEIFKQEGWHYELNAKDEKLGVNGIVYSEMKGAFSSPSSRQMRGTLHAMFPDTVYGCESGGDPEFICDLRYEDFLDFHKRYYHPTNSYIFLYGDMDVEERLNWLDENYLSEYDYQPVDSEIKYQEPVGVKDVTEYYPLGDEDKEENATYLTCAMGIGLSDEIEKNVALDIICDVLFNASGAPVKQKLIDAGIGQDINCGVERDIYQPIIMTVIKNTEADRLPLMKQIMKEELEAQVKSGLNKESLLASLNKAEFAYSEADYGSLPKGIAYCISALDTWLYDDDKAFNALKMKELFPVLREKIGTDYYEKLIEKYMLNSENMVYYVLAPKKGLGAEIDAKLEKKLAEYKASLDDEQLEALVKDTAALKEYQETPSTKEELDTIPMLERESIGKEAAPIVNEHDSINGVPVVYHEFDTNGIVYLELLFDLDRVPERLIPYASLISKMMGNMDTDRHSYFELDNEVNIHTGGISTIVGTYGKNGKNDIYRPTFNINGKALSHELDKLVELMTEELLCTDYSSTKRIRELMAETKSRMQSFFVSAGHAVALKRAQACISSAGRFKELVDGIDYYRFVDFKLGAFDTESEAIVAGLKEFAAMVFGRDNMMINITCDRQLYNRFKECFAEKLDMLPEVREGDNSERIGMSFEHKILNEGYKIPGQVQYVVAAGQYDYDDEKYSGILSVLRTILNNEYLWTNIRILGGAYGGGSVFNSNGYRGCFYSYRDPKLADTLEVYKKAVDYIREFTADEREMTKYIIGTIGEMDTPLSPRAKGARSFDLYMSDISFDMVQNTRNYILAATDEDIRATADIVNQIVSAGNICVVGNEATIEANREIFGQVKNLISGD